jgi:hypothetical protein
MSAYLDSTKADQLEHATWTYICRSYHDWSSVAARLLIRLNFELVSAHDSRQ